MVAQVLNAWTNTVAQQPRQQSKKSSDTGAKEEKEYQSREKWKRWVPNYFKKIDRDSFVF